MDPGWVAEIDANQEPGKDDAFSCAHWMAPGGQPDGCGPWTPRPTTESARGVLNARAASTYGAGPWRGTDVQAPRGRDALRAARA